MTPAVLRYSAFTTDPSGGNPAGVVLDARGLSDAAMQRIAADVGYSETAFLLPRADGELDVRYFSPLAEVSFCGHATIAAMVAHARRQGPGDFVLHTQAGRVRVTVDAGFIATLTSVPPRVEALDAADLDSVLGTLRWQRDDLDPVLPPAVAYAGAWHPVIAVATRAFGRSALRLRCARCADGVARLDHDQSGLARRRAHAACTQSVPTRRRGGGSGHWRCRRGAGCVSGGAGPVARRPQVHHSPGA